MASGHRVRARIAALVRAAAQRPAPLTLAAAIGALAALLPTLVLPYLDESRHTLVEVPQPAPLFSVSLVELLPHERGCVDEIGLLPGEQVAQMRVGTYGKPASPLLVTLQAPGYREAVPVAPTYVDNGLLDVPFDGPPTVLEGSFCVANRGRFPVALYASADRTKSRSTTTVDGHLWPSNFDLAFYSAKRRSLLDILPAIMRRLRLFHAHVGLGLLWLLLALMVIGVPVAVTAVVVSASRERDAD
jgi:hypothetical protein